MQTYFKVSDTEAGRVEVVECCGGEVVRVVGDFATLGEALDAMGLFRAALSQVEG